MQEKNNKLLVQLSVGDLQQLIKEAVKEELNKLTEVIKLKNPKESVQDSNLLTKKQTEELLKVSATTLYLWNRDNVLPNKKIGNRVYYLKTDVYNKLNTVA
ncbi:helix-turn-helix domain-containing protein [Flavobacterium oreochromis]|uniref:helix-turn-helix transcriptional regulator n=1 Tax=Flavobacterium oreochromis TaxID=2906078 RepID=UPI001CE6DCD6|nr:helix-turn-helix domain-containing protein [Flavobacterium oreochromis]QYS87172.1 helix-turn-helix domain-containing protein [Flavobacterium oreochromis]